MKRINFADTDDQVSVMALGCLAYGTKVSKEKAFEQLDYYREQGGNFLDTSNNYSFWEAGGRGGESERVLGEWFSQRGSRESMFLGTKVGAFPTVSNDEFFSYKGNPWNDLTEGLKAEGIIKSVENSLKRMNTDYIDLLFAHVDDRQTEQEETLEAFDKLVKQGKVKHLGCSNFHTWRIIRSREISLKRGWTPYKSVQQFYTYYKTEPGAETGMFDQLSEDLFDYVRSGNPMALLAYTPLLWGSYEQTWKYKEEDRLKNFLRPQNEERRKRLEKIMSETGWTINQVIYSWMMNSTPEVIPLVAVTKMEHLKENLSASDLILTKEQIEYLNRTLN